MCLSLLVQQQATARTTSEHHSAQRVHYSFHSVNPPPPPQQQQTLAMVGSLYCGILLLLLSVALLVPLPTDAFLTKSSTARRARPVHGEPLRLHLAAATLPSSAKDDVSILRKQSSETDAQTLLELLVREPETPSQDPTIIRSLITRLTKAQVTFDPAECLNGPLYAVVHQQGPKVPRWEKIGRLLPFTSKNANIKGQQFVFRPDTQSFDIVNYAEVFGRGIYFDCVFLTICFFKLILMKLTFFLFCLLGLFVQVEGTAKAVQKSVGSSSRERDTPTKHNKKSFWDGISNFLEPLLPTTNTEQSALSKSLTFQCPCDIEATVNGGGLYTAMLLGERNDDDDDKKLLLDLPMIQGTGLVRVLYADPQLRIFLSPTQGDGGWEDQGLVVVQVRKDLL